jgi:hypothetical protein
MIKISINLSKVDKSRLRVDKNGDKWGDFILMDSRNPQYGDYSVKMDKKKDENIQLPFIGNGKNLGGGGGTTRTSSEGNSSSGGSSRSVDDMPF